MRIVLGSDQLGHTLKEDIRTYLDELGHQTVDVEVDLGTVDVDYPDVGREAAERIAAGEFDRGILVCGTGIGMAITANKIPGVRAAVCHDPYSAERARKSNDAQVMALGAQIVAPSLARSLIDHWLGSEFNAERSGRKVAKINAIDSTFRGGSGQR